MLSQGGRLPDPPGVQECALCGVKRVLPESFQSNPARGQGGPRRRTSHLVCTTYGASRQGPRCLVLREESGKSRPCGPRRLSASSGYRSCTNR
ncbi:hypothetical protein MTO96_036077 [Rhipicephalus appendiculatus]